MKQESSSNQTNSINPSELRPSEKFIYENVESRIHGVSRNLLVLIQNLISLEFKRRDMLNEDN